MDLPPPLPGVNLPPPLPAATRRRRPVWPWAVGAFFLIFGAFGAFVIYRAFTGPLAEAFRVGLRRGVSAGANRRPSGESFSRKEVYARQPVTFTPGAGLHADDTRRAVAWSRRNVLDAYDRVGRRNPRWDAAARDFLARALPRLAGALDDPEPAALLPAADALLAAGCDDPAVLLLAGLLHADVDPESVEANPLLARAVEGFRTTPYPRGVARLAAGLFVEDCADRLKDGTGRGKTAGERQLEWFGQSLTDGSYLLNDDEQSVLAQHYAGEPGYRFFEAERAACCRMLTDAGDGRVAPWVRLYLSGKRHAADAWAARGSGYADTVTPEGRQGFMQGLADARRDLVESWRLNPRQPEAAANMIRVVMGETHPPDGETERTWFDRATAAQFDYLPAYNYLLWALRPRWGGSERAMLQFGLACADTRRFDTAVPAMLAEAARDVGAERDDWAAAFTDPLLVDRLDRVYAGYAAAPGLSAVQRREWAGERVLCAYYQKRSADAYKWLGELDYQIAPEICRRWREHAAGRRVRDHLAILVSPANKRLYPAAQAVTAGHREKAAELYRAVLADPAAMRDPRVARYCRSKLAALELALRLANPANDGWQPFLPVPEAENPGELPGWETKLGRWQIEPDGALRGTSGAQGLMLVSEAAVGPDWEWRGDVEAVASTNGAWQAGVVFGYPEWIANGRKWRCARLKRNGREGEVATAGRTFAHGPMQRVALGATGTRNRLVVQSWRGRVNVFVNGRLTVTDPAPAKGDVAWVDQPDARVGFGGYADDNRCEVRFRNVQLRRLSAEPPPPPAGEDGRQVSR